MPVVQLTLIKGYSAEFRRHISGKITDLVVQLSGAVPEGTTVTIQELDQASYMRGRQKKNPIPPPPSASQIVLDYLAAMEARDLDKAKTYLADGFWMEFPGAVRMTSLDELIAWSKPRYEKVGKTYDGFAEAYGETETVVTCHGMLHGVWLDGSPFSDIRFVDRFTLVDGQLTSQMVWNDLAEVAPQG